MSHNNGETGLEIPLIDVHTLAFVFHKTVFFENLKISIEQLKDPVKSVYAYFP